MPAWTVSRRATDSSGRGIYSSEYMWSWWQDVVAELGFTPVITQGAWMSIEGDGASASAGYHDGGGCFDLRTWNLTPEQRRDVVRVVRRRGAAIWLRNEQHGGFDEEHFHLVLGTDYDLDDGAAYQWADYINGGDGMGGSDYHPRPVPLVTTPPEDDDMAFTDWPEADQTALVDAVARAVTKRLLDADLTPNKDEPKSTVRAALNRVLKT